MNVKKIFGKKIKEKRIALNLTQESLAEKIGISPKSLSQIELGNNFVSAENLEAICVALNVLPNNLFDFSQQNDDEKFEYITKKIKQNKNLAEKIYKIIEIIE